MRRSTTNGPDVVDPVTRAAALLRSADRVFAVTGAGMARGSGVAPIDGTGAIFGTASQVTAPVFAEDLEHRPAEVFQFVQHMRDTNAGVEPHSGHHALTRAQQRCWSNGGEFALVTMNIDDLHERAGSDAVHLHGTGKVDRCRRECRVHLPATTQPARCPECGGPTRPDVVLYGEPIDLDVEWAGKHALRRAEVMLAVGIAGATNLVTRWVIEARRDCRIPTVLVAVDPDPEFAALFDLVLPLGSASLDLIL